MKNLISTGLGIVILLAFGACKPSAASQKQAAVTAPKKLLDWNTRSLVDAYQTAGHTDPKCDDSAKCALTEFARMRRLVLDADEDARLILSYGCAAAVRAGCDDPMIRYIFVRNCMDPSEGNSAFAEAYGQAAVAMENGSYTNIRKYYAWLRAGKQVRSAYNYAWCAYQAKEGAAFNDIIPKIEPVSYSYFGGKDQFESMVAQAKQLAGEAT